MPIASIFLSCLWLLYIFTILSIDKTILDSDLYYHLSVAKLYSSQEQILRLPWAEESIWSSGFGDTHLLYHQLLRIANSIGIKQFIALLIGINLFVFLRVNKAKSIYQHIGLLCLFFFGSYVFTGRLLFAKGLIVFLPLLFYYILKWKEKNLKFIFVLSFFSVWTYPLSPILLLYSTIDLLVKKIILKNKFYIKELTVAYIAFGLGIIFHPSFPNQFLMFFWEWYGQIFPSPNIEPIAEWMAPGILLYLKTFSVLGVLGIVFYKKSDLSLGIIFTLGMISSIFTTKSIEWTVPFGLIWIASSESFQNFIKQSFSIKIFIPAVLLGSSLLGMGVKNQLSYQANFNKREYASFLCRNLPDNIKIWIRWDDFQEFVYECPNRIYPFGLNPLYAYIKDPVKYKMIQSFWQDASQDRTQTPIYMGYEAIFIYPSMNDKRLVDNLLKSPNWKLAYNFPNALVFLYTKIEDTNQNRKVKIIPKNFILPKKDGK